MTLIVSDLHLRRVYPRSVFRWHTTESMHVASETKTTVSLDVSYFCFFHK
jgi:hypothetical protein